MAELGMLQPTSKLIAGGTVNATGASPSFQLPLADTYNLSLSVTAAAGSVTPTLQHSPDGGTTWLNVPLTWNAVATAPGNSAVLFTLANVPIFVKFVRVLLTLGTAGATTYAVWVTMSERGTVVH